MLQFQSLTNVRPTKDLGTQIILAPTEGQFKITPDAAKLIGVEAGDYLQIQKDKTSGDVYVNKGEEKGLGSKLASSNKVGGGILTLSAANAWEDMEGSTGHNIQYNIDETPVRIDFTDPNAPVQLEEEDESTEATVSYFKLIFDEAVEKQTRKKKGSKDEESDEEVEEEGNFEDI